MTLYKNRRNELTMPIRFGLTLLLLACCSMRAQSSPFSDVPRNHWAYAYYDRLVKAGVAQWPVCCYNISGSRAYPDRGFRLTRYEFAVMAQRTLDAFHRQPVSGSIRGRKRISTDVIHMLKRLVKEFHHELRELNSDPKDAESEA